MFVYLSESYREVYKERAEVLARNKNRFYSNDMVYNTMVGLLNVHTDHYDGREDISSEEYAYDKDTVLTFLGQEHASDY
jgi:heptose-I-phosphate ethanolaminephosphotransferase